MFSPRWPRCLFPLPSPASCWLVKKPLSPSLNFGALSQPQNVFFLLAGPYQPPAEEDRAAYCPELRSRGAEVSCNNRAHPRALRIFDTIERDGARDGLPPPLFLSSSLFFSPPPPTFYSQGPRTFSLAGKRKSHYRIMVHLAGPTGSPAITTGFLTGLASV